MAGAAGIDDPPDSDRAASAEPASRNSTPDTLVDSNGRKESAVDVVAVEGGRDGAVSGKLPPLSADHFRQLAEIRLINLERVPMDVLDREMRMTLA